MCEVWPHKYISVHIGMCSPFLRMGEHLGMVCLQSQLSVLLSKYIWHYKNIKGLFLFRPSNNGNSTDSIGNLRL